MSALPHERTSRAWPVTSVKCQLCTSGVAARWADRLIYLKTVSETRAQLTFGRQRYVQTNGR
jgi:hypothetical protein